MRKLKKVVSMASEETEELFVQIVSDIKNTNEAKILLSDLLTETEQIAIAKRLAVALSLTNRKSYEEIKKNFQVSSATIAKVQESLDTPGMKLAIEKIRVDDWASAWAKKLASLIEKILGK